MTIVMEELMVNAFKYSARGSTINVFCHVNHGYFWVNIKNDVTLKPYGGVPKEYEKLVLEPFTGFIRLMNRYQRLKKLASVSVLPLSIMLQRSTAEFLSYMMFAT